MSNGRIQYRVAISAAQREQLRVWQTRFIEAGVEPTQDRFIEAGVEPTQEQSPGQIAQRLSTDPRDWGDPYGEFRALRLLAYRGHQDGILVFYGVDPVRHAVYVSEFQLAPWHPLNRGQAS